MITIKQNSEGNFYLDVTLPFNNMKEDIRDSTDLLWNQLIDSFHKDFAESNFCPDSISIYQCSSIKYTNREYFLTPDEEFSTINFFQNDKDDDEKEITLDQFKKDIKADIRMTIEGYCKINNIIVKTFQNLRK